MMKPYRFLLAAFVGLLMALPAGSAPWAASPTDGPTFIPADDARIAYMGRISHRIPGAVTFTYPGVSIFARAAGTSWWR